MSTCMYFFPRRLMDMSMSSPKRISMIYPCLSQVNHFLGEVVFYCRHGRRGPVHLQNRLIVHQIKPLFYHKFIKVNIGRINVDQSSTHTILLTVWMLLVIPIVGIKHPHKYWGRDKMVDTSQTTFSNVFSSMELLKFHWNLLLSNKLTTFQHWFR